MKSILLILISIITINAFGQASLVMSKRFTVSPSNALSSSIGVAIDSVVTISGYIKNKGSSVFTGTLNLKIKVNPILGSPGIVRTAKSFSSTSIAANDSIFFEIKDSVKSSIYKKIAGNGNTIVVWPVSGAGTIDSLFTLPIYTSDIVGLQEREFEILNIFPNPTSQKLFLKPKTGITYQKVVIYDNQMRLVLVKPFETSIDVEFLSIGKYVVIVSDTSGKLYSSNFIKIE